jgi:DNA-binding CsgD family transcriptional regulator
MSSKEIALNLDISHNTVETHRKNMFAKLKVNNVAELIKKASKLYWLQ